MINYTAIAHQQHDPFSAIPEEKGPRRDYPFITPMRLLDLLWKTDDQHHDLKPAEKAALSVLITHVNLNEVARNRVYEAWPTIDRLCERTGISKRTIEGARRTLEKKGWIRVIPGRGPGSANHYFINGRKIVEAHNLSNVGFEVSMKPDRFGTINICTPKRRRNTSGLRRGLQSRGQSRSVNEIPLLLSAGVENPQILPY